MIWNDELAGASLDQIAGVVVLQKSELSKLQQLAVTLVDKATAMTDANDRYLDVSPAFRFFAPSKPWLAIN